MKTASRVRSRLSLLLCVAAVVGCGGGGPQRPEITPVSGVVSVRGKPLPKAVVVFIPSGVEGDFRSADETDEEGRYELLCSGDPGAVVGEHTVLVKESQPPPDLLTESKLPELIAYRKGLANRPIPKMYGSPVSSPLRVTVTPDQAVYDLELE